VATPKLIYGAASCALSLILASLAFFLFYQGLDRANKWASVLALFITSVSLGVTAIRFLAQGRRTKSEPSPPMDSEPSPPMLKPKYLVNNYGDPMVQLTGDKNRLKIRRLKKVLKR
jgi:hypothetical protein